MVHQNSKELKSPQYPKIYFWELLKVVPLLFTVLLLFACASAPKPETFYEGRSGFALMAEGAELYITAKVQSVRPILDSLTLGGMNGGELKDFLDVSDVLTAAFFPPTDVWHFYAAASGSFPSARGEIYFGSSKSWEKKLSAAGMPYWYSPQSRLSVSLNSRMAYLSDADPFVPPPGAQFPQALSALQKGAVLSGWMNDPARAFGNVAAAFPVPVTIPAKRMLFAVYPEPSGQYSAVLHLETPSPAQAAALIRAFALAKLALAVADFSGDEEIEILSRAFFSQTPKAEGNVVILNTGVMEGKSVALLFNAFSVY
ncbi:MAG: hypothetical protein LBB72_04455 [Spirochaetaceae bacterium]|nr:hypothetical protein [Spirochaetaceae bacterium]